jgi:hypothetical protein
MSIIYYGKFCLLMFFFTFFYEKNKRKIIFNTLLSIILKRPFHIHRIHVELIIQIIMNILDVLDHIYFLLITKNCKQTIKYFFC